MKQRFSKRPLQGPKGRVRRSHQPPARPVIRITQRLKRRLAVSNNDLCARIQEAKRKSKELGVPEYEEEEEVDMKNPDIDVVIPLSGTMYLPHMENCLASISKQNFHGGDIGITVSCVMYEQIDIVALTEVCMKYEATLVFTKPRHKSFSRGFALNVGARQGSRKLIAFIDADVYLHPKTFKLAAAQCMHAVMAVIPVVRTKNEPDHEVWTSGKLDQVGFWQEFTKKLKYAKGGYGNAVVRRDVFEKIHGHDERFYGWGGIDTDIYFRMLKSGRVVDLDDVSLPRALHQKHDPPISKKDPEDTKRNRQLLSDSRDIRRNPDRWGRVRCK